MFNIRFKFFSNVYLLPCSSNYLSGGPVSCEPNFYTSLVTISVDINIFADAIIHIFEDLFMVRKPGDLENFLFTSDGTLILTFLPLTDFSIL